jgi:hypothetical protein
MTPCRNKIVFTAPLTDYTLSLCNNPLSTYLHTHKATFTDGKTYTFYSGENGINPERVTESIRGHRISRWPHTFHQNDDAIRDALYTVLHTHIPSPVTSSLYIGGECYLFPRLCPSLYTEIMTDTACIADDARINNPDARVQCASYSDLHLHATYDVCIINVNKKGLPSRLLDQVTSQSLFMIYCNEATHHRDVSVLQSRYHVRHQWTMGNSVYHIYVSQLNIR